MIQRIRAPLLVALATVLACWKPLFHGEFTLLAGSDMARAYYPYFDVAAYWLKRGVFLLWDPYVYAGKANMGEPQPGLYYPLNWLFLLLPARDGGVNLDGMQALVVLDFFLAAYFTYLLARACGQTRPGAGVAALAFAFGGYTVQLYGYVNKFSGFVWMPLALLCFRRALREQAALGRARWAAGGGIVLALTFLPGHHIPAVHTALLLAAYAGFVLAARWGEMSARARVGIVAVLAGVAAVAVLVTALQWLPSAEWARHVYRWTGDGPPLEWRERVRYASLERTGNLTPQNALSFLLPYVSTNANLYVGPAVAFAALVGALFGRPRDSRFFAAAAIVYFFLSWGRFSVLHGWLNTFVPGVWFAREVFHYLVPLELCLAMLAGFGADRIVSAFAGDSDPALRLFVRRAGWGMAAAAAGALALAGVLHLAREVPLDDSHLAGLGALAANLGVLGLLVFLLYTGRLRAAGFQTGLLALVLVDLASHFSEHLPTKNAPAGAENTYVRSFWRKPPAARFLEARRTRELFRVDDPSHVFPQNFGDVWRIEATMGHGATALVDYFALRGTGWGPASNASALLNVRYFPSRVPIAGMTKVFDDGTAVYENPRAVPRAFLTSSSRVFARDAELLGWLGSPLFDPGRTALLVERDASALPEELRGARDRLHPQVLACRTGAQKRAEGLDDPEERARLDLFQPSWGRSAGDEVTVAVGPEAPLEHCFVAVDYTAPPGSAGVLDARISGPAGMKTVPIPLPGGAGRRTRAAVDLGRLEAAAYQVSIERTAECGAVIERLSLSEHPPADLADAGTVEVTSFEPNRIVIAADARRPSLLVCSEVFYPGWQAAVDGARAPLVRVDHVLRGVAVPEGRHTVEMRFHSKTFLAGLSISIVATAALVAFLVLARDRKAEVGSQESEDGPA